MALILPVLDKSPMIAEECFLAPNSTIVGDVEIGHHCSVWFNAVIRGDVNYIRIGHYTNIQDGAVIHCTYKKCGTTIGNYVNIGHQAMVHGCVVEDHVLIDHQRLQEYILPDVVRQLCENQYSLFRL